MLGGNGYGCSGCSRRGGCCVCRIRGARIVAVTAIVVVIAGIVVVVVGRGAVRVLIVIVLLLVVDMFGFLGGLVANDAASQKRHKYNFIRCINDEIYIEI